MPTLTDSAPLAPKVPGHELRYGLLWKAMGYLWYPMVRHHSPLLSMSATSTRYTWVQVQVQHLRDERDHDESKDMLHVYSSKGIAAFETEYICMTYVDDMWVLRRPE